jgi:methionine-rich copper-binding protein CopC
MTASRTLRLAASIALSALLAGLVTGTVLGHAELATVTPADKSTVQGPPEEIVMTFTQNLDPLKSSIVVVDAAGKVLVQGGIIAGSPREMYLPLPGPLPVGAYEIRWTTFSSEDQEQARGTTTFTVAAAASVAPSTATESPSAGASVAPSGAPSVVVSAAPSSPPTTPAASTNDAVIPIIVALIVLAGLGMWLLRGRARSR